MGPLDRIVRDRIAADGPMPFVEFMRLALYHPEHGYYVSGPPRGYVTSPGLSPLFGRLVGRFVERLWKAAGRPDVWEVREVGPGAGDLALAALDAAAGPFASALRWTLVEPHERVEAIQRERLGSRVSWAPSLEAVEPAPGVVLANEVLDNLPVHLLEVRDGSLWEGRVHPGGELRFDASPPDEVRAVVEAHPLEEGQRLEVGLEAVGWVRSAGAALREGYVVVVDYGHEDPWSDRPEGTLLSYVGGEVTEDVLTDPGSRDITVFVHLSRLRDAGLRHVGTTTQRELLLELGLRDELDALRAAASSASGAESLRLHSARAAGAELARRGGMGDFAVLVLAKDAPDVPLPRRRPVEGFPSPPPI